MDMIIRQTICGKGSPMEGALVRRAGPVVARLIAVDTADGAAIVTLDCPDQLNAYSVAMNELVAALGDSDRDDDVRAVVVAGAGQAFCAGVDLADPDAFSRSGDDDDRAMARQRW